MFCRETRCRLKLVFIWLFMEFLTTLQSKAKSLNLNPGRHRKRKEAATAFRPKGRRQHPDPSWPPMSFVPTIPWVSYYKTTSPAPYQPRTKGLCCLRPQATWDLIDLGSRSPEGSFGYWLEQCVVQMCMSIFWDSKAVHVTWMHTALLTWSCYWALRKRKHHINCFELIVP